MSDFRISIGNAEDFAHGPTRGWFIGGFLDPTTAGLRFTDDLEVKWSVHPEGDERPGIAPGADTATLTILISGAFEQIFPDDQRTHRLERPGDFALFGPGVPHTWRALADSVMLTVRWQPSTASAETAAGQHGG